LRNADEEINKKEVKMKLPEENNDKEKKKEVETSKQLSDDLYQLFLPVDKSDKATYVI